jgi:hypothetical protein
MLFISMSIRSTSSINFYCWACFTLFSVKVMGFRGAELFRCRLGRPWDRAKPYSLKPFTQCQTRVDLDVSDLAIDLFVCTFRLEDLISRQRSFEIRSKRLPRGQMYRYLVHMYTHRTIQVHPHKPSWEVVAGGTGHRNQMSWWILTSDCLVYIMPMIQLPRTQT